MIHQPSFAVSEDEKDFVILRKNLIDKTYSMKKIEAIIRTTQFNGVQDALAKIGVRFFSIKEVRGYGLQKGETRIYRGSELGPGFIPRLQMDIVTSGEDVDEIVKTIESSARTGEVGDGKIFVFDVEKAVRIRTGERDESAI